MLEVHRQAWNARRALLNSFPIVAANIDVDSLRNRQETALGRSQAILNRAEAENRELTVEEKNTIQANTSMVDSLEGQIQAMLAAPLPRLTPAGAGERPDSELLIAGSRVGSTPHTSSTSERSGPRLLAAGSARYADVFGQPTPARGFKNLGDFCRALVLRDTQRLENAATGMNEGFGGEGGFMVPSGFVQAIMDSSLESELIRPRARIVKMTAPHTSVPFIDATNRANSAVGGLRLKWAAEGSSGGSQKAKTSVLNLHAHKGSILVPITRELLEDGPGLQSVLIESMGSAIGFGLDSSFLRGTGAGEPLGILTSPAKIAVTKDASQVAATITATNVTKMISRMLPSSFSKAIWVAHPTTIDQLMRLTVIVKNVAANENVGGFGAPLFQMNADGQATLATRPVLFSEHASVLGTEGDLMLIDPTQYAVGLLRDVRLDTDPYSGFENDEIKLRLSLRIDGQPLLPNAVTPAQGSTTLSAFITVETRG